jgi:hypothetical protein
MFLLRWFQRRGDQNAALSPRTLGDGWVIGHHAFCVIAGTVTATGMVMPVTRWAPRRNGRGSARARQHANHDVAERVAGDCVLDVYQHLSVALLALAGQCETYLGVPLAVQDEQEGD